jgi:HPt (histidine-containing phosphotransfer) domain-containing protein
LAVESLTNLPGIDTAKGLAQRLSHTIKEVAGNIGAEELQKAGSDLELAIKQEKFKDAQGRIDPFEAALDRIIKSLKGLPKMINH